MPKLVTKYVKLSVLGCLLGMSAGVVVAASLRDAAAEHPALDLNNDLAHPPATAASTVTAANLSAARRPHPGGAGYENHAMHALPTRLPNAPLPPSWQSLLPGAIRL